VSLFQRVEEEELISRIIPEDQKDGVRQRLLLFLEEPDFAVCPPWATSMLMVDCSPAIILTRLDSPY
jgi:hypothetical protein